MNHSPALRIVSTPALRRITALSRFCGPFTLWVALLFAALLSRTACAQTYSYFSGNVAPNAWWLVNATYISASLTEANGQRVFEVYNPTAQSCWVASTDAGIGTAVEVNARSTFRHPLTIYTQNGAPIRSIYATFKVAIAGGSATPPAGTTFGNSGTGTNPGGGNGGSGGGSPPATGSNLRIYGGTWSASGAQLTIQTTRLVNESYLASSNNIMLQVWASDQLYRGGTLIGWRVGAASVGGFAPRSGILNLVKACTFTPPPAGNRYTTLLVTEYVPAQNIYVIRDFVALGQTLFR